MSPAPPASDGWHPAQDLAWPNSLRLLFLPPYSPQLNPVQPAREYLRENHSGADTFPTLKAVGTRLATGLHSFGKQTDPVRSLTCFDRLDTIRMSSNHYEPGGSAAGNST